ncbi:MAG: endonuclease/exonuclease/phosphatase family protein, partial [Kofleriaceae bacterium]
MSLRIVSWNVESLIPWLAPAPLRDLPRQVAALGEPQILCLQEIRVRPRDHDLIATMRDLLPGYTCQFALCDDPRNVTYRGGRAYGVATYVHDSLGPALAASPPWDHEGRVLVTALPERRLAVVNLYAVNGTSKAYVDPASGDPAGDRHAYKQRFQDQVLTLAEELRTTADVVLAGDWNVSRSAHDVTPRLRTEEPHATARARLNDRLAREDWIDIFRHCHPEARSYTWFGRRRVLVSARLMSASAISAEPG